MFARTYDRLMWTTRPLAIACLGMLGLPSNAPAQATRTLTVGSMPFSDVNVTISPPDLDGLAGARSVFSRRYADGELVTVEAPPVIGAHIFVKWQRNGVDPDHSSQCHRDDERGPHFEGALFCNSQVLVNGSFESEYAGWTFSGNQNVDTGDPEIATDGSSWVAFNGGDETPNGVLRQVITTAPGKTYTLAFDAGLWPIIMNSKDCKSASQEQAPR